MNNEFSDPRRFSFPSKFKILAFVGKGGEGKTFASVNVSVALSRISQKNRSVAPVLYIDCDSGSDSHNINWDIETPLGVAEFYAGRCNLADIIVTKRCQVESEETLVDILSLSGIEVFDNDAIEKLFYQLSHCNYSFIILDIGAGLKNEMFRFVSLATHIIVISNHNINALNAAVEIMGSAFERNEHAFYSLLVNRIDIDTDKARVADGIHRILKSKRSLRGCVRQFDKEEDAGGVYSNLTENNLVGYLETLKNDINLKSYFDIRKIFYRFTESGPIEKFVTEKMEKQSIFLKGRHLDEKTPLTLSAVLSPKFKNLSIKHHFMFEADGLNEEPGRQISTKKVLLHYNNRKTYGSLFYSIRNILEESKELHELQSGTFLKRFLQSLEQIGKDLSFWAYHRKHVRFDSVDLPTIYRSQLLKISEQKVFQKCAKDTTLFLSPKGGVGQSCVLATIASIPSSSKILIIDLSVTIKNGYSPYHGYLELDETKGGDFFKEGKLFSYNKNVDLYLSPILVETEIENNFHNYLESFSNRYTELCVAGKYDHVFLDCESGWGAKNRLLANLFNHYACCSDITDAESYQKLFTMLNRLAQDKLQGRAGLTSNNLTLLFTKMVEEKKMVGEQSLETFRQRMLATFEKSPPIKKVFGEASVQILHHYSFLKEWSKCEDMYLKISSRKNLLSNEMISPSFKKDLALLKRLFR